MCRIVSKVLTLSGLQLWAGAFVAYQDMEHAINAMLRTMSEAHVCTHNATDSCLVHNP